MASCAYCNTTILFGGKKQGNLRFCNTECEQRGLLMSVANEIPQRDVDGYVARVRRGNCPNCDGQGPVDVHTSHRVWSALVMTSWSSRPAISCQGCGSRRKIGDTAFSLLLGWWGFPWGVLVTPWQIGKNILGFFQAPDPAKPSAALEKMLRLHLAAEVVKNRQ